MRELKKEKIEPRFDFEVVKTMIIGSARFDDRHLMGWKRLILPQD